MKFKIENFYSLRLSDQNAMNNIEFWLGKKEKKLTISKNAKTFSFCKDLYFVILPR